MTPEEVEQKTVDLLAELTVQAATLRNSNDPAEAKGAAAKIKAIAEQILSIRVFPE